MARLFSILAHTFKLLEHMTHNTLSGASIMRCLLINVDKDIHNYSTGNNKSIPIPHNGLDISKKRYEVLGLKMHNKLPAEIGRTTHQTIKKYNIKLFKNKLRSDFSQIAVLFYPGFFVIHRDCEMYYFTC